MTVSNSKFRLKFLFQEFDLSEGVFEIGRSPSCNLTLADPLVSRCHAKITVAGDEAFIEDLGSRNGTLINGQPIFENHRLLNGDRIRIGAHDLMFVQERRSPAARQKTTGVMINCGGCGAPFLEGTGRCPHCGVPEEPHCEICRRCRTPMISGRRYCERCGTSVRRDDQTIPVELGGASAGWTSQLIDDVISKALKVKRWEQAAKLLNGRIGQFDKNAAKGQPDEKELIVLSGFCIELAKRTKEPSHISWVINQWQMNHLAMSADLLQELLQGAAGWYDLKTQLRAYLAMLESVTTKATKDMLDHLRSAIVG